MAASNVERETELEMEIARRDAKLEHYRTRLMQTEGALEEHKTATEDMAKSVVALQQRLNHVMNENEDFRYEAEQLKKRLADLND